MMEYNNNYYNNYMGGVAPYSTQPAMMMPFQQPKNINALSDEEVKILSQAKPSSKIEINISKEDNIRSMCTHKYNGKDMVVPVNDGSGDVYCPICGARWNPEMMDKTQIKECIDKIIAQMQNSKWVGDLNTSLVREYYPMIPLLEKFPDIHEYSMQTYNKYFNQNGYSGADEAAIYAQYNSLMGYSQPVYPQGYMPQPGQPTMMQQGMPVPTPYQQAPMANPMQAPMNPQFTDQANMMMNGGYYAQPTVPQQGYMPAPTPAFAPAQPAVQAAAPTQPTATNAEAKTVVKID